MKKLLISLLIIFMFIFGTSNVYALDVIQDSLEVKEKSSTIIVDDEGIGQLEITPQIVFNKIDNYITYKLVLKNNDKEKYKIESITDDNQNETLDVEYDYNNELNDDNKEILITLKCIKEPSLDVELKNIKVIIRLVDEDNNIEEINTKIDSPLTGDNIKIYYYISFISLLGIILTILFYKKSKKTRRRLFSFLIIVFMLVPIAAYALSYQEVIFMINLNNDNSKINLEHTVKFDSDGGSPVSDQIVKHNEKAIKPDNPTKRGYEFVKWIDEDNNEYNFNSSITKDITLKAIWNPIVYHIFYVLGGGIVNPKNPTTYTIETETFTLTNPTHNEYTFYSWMKAELIPGTYVINNDDENNNEYEENIEFINPDTLYPFVNQPTEIGKEAVIEKGTTGDLIFASNWLIGNPHTPH